MREYRLVCDGHPVVVRQNDDGTFAIPEAFGGHGGTALKPAHEPIVLARKPLIGTVAANVLAHGTGGLNVDGCRIGMNKDVPASAAKDRIGQIAKGDEKGRTTNTPGFNPNIGRFPANVLFSHSEDCTDEECASDCPVAELDRQSGMLKSRSRKAGTYKGLGDMGAEEWDLPAIKGDSGGASRFFYVAKPNRKERDAGCEHLPARTGGEATGREDDSAGTHSPRAGAGRTGGARNIHPTVKPIDLMRYLVRLVTPPGGLVLDPFTGSGTTGCAALLEGVQFVGCELDEKGEYLPIIEARLRYWAPEAFADTADISDLL